MKKLLLSFLFVLCLTCCLFFGCDRKVTKIEVTDLTKLSYTAGEQLDLSQLKIVKTFSDESQSEITDYTIKLDDVEIDKNYVFTQADVSESKTLSVNVDNVYKKFTISVGQPILSNADLLNEISLGEEDDIYYVGENVDFSFYNSSVAKNKKFTIVGQGVTKSTIVVGSRDIKTGEANGDYGLEGSQVTFKNIHIASKKDSIKSNYQGFIRAHKLTFKNCVIDGMFSFWGIGDVIFDNCTFNKTGDWNMWTYSGRNFVFSDCTFVSSKGGVNIYTEKGNDVDVTFNNTKFYVADGETTKPCTQVAEDYTPLLNRYTVTFNNCAIDESFADGTFGKYLLNKSGFTEDNLSVKINGIKKI